MTNESGYRGVMKDLGEPKSVILRDEWIEAQLPHGWFIEQAGYWYTACLGEMYNTRPYTSIRAAIEAAWTAHNGTGRPWAAVAEKFTQRRSIDKEVRQMTLDDLL